MNTIRQSSGSEVGNGTVTADFTRATAKFRPALHSSGFAPGFERAYMAAWDEKIKEMNFDYVRSHDLGLVNLGSRAFDVQYVFPLMHLDPAKPENYFFATTDFMLDLQCAIGQKPFYRLGTSIEHTGLSNAANVEGWSVVVNGVPAEEGEYALRFDENSVLRVTRKRGPTVLYMR